MIKPNVQTVPRHQPQASQTTSYIKKTTSQRQNHTDTTDKEWPHHARIHTPYEELDYMTSIAEEKHIYRNLIFDFNNLQ
jgi:hypothetical protein